MAVRLCLIGYNSTALSAYNYIEPDNQLLDDPDTDLVAYIVSPIAEVDTKSPDNMEVEAPKHLISYDSVFTYTNSLIAYAEQ